MKRLAHLHRLLTIWGILASHRIDGLLPTSLPASLRVLLYFFRLHPAWWWPRRRSSPAQGLRLAMEELGPVFIKLGQLIATRRDLLPAAVLDELSHLQDDVRPFSPAIACRIVETEFGRPLAACFARFDLGVLAAASLAQVHTAQLFDGREVVVKVLRPGMAQAIRSDLGLLLSLAHLLEMRWSEAQRLHLSRVVMDYENTLLDECDLRKEAANAQQLRNNFLDSNLLYVPAVIDDMVSSQVLVSERIYGVPINDRAALDAAQVNRRALAENGLTVFFTQLLRDNFFHADMHPGNVFVDLANPENPRYIALDCAVIGSLRKKDQVAVARIGMALTQRNFTELLRIAYSAGWIPPGSELDELEEALRRLIEPLLSHTIAQVNFGPTLLQLLDLAREYRLLVPTRFVLLLKTLVHVEGLGRNLYPDLDIWSLSRPLLSRWLAEQIGPQAFMRQVSASLPQLASMLPELPHLVHDSLLQGRRAGEQREAQETLLRQLRQEMRAQQRRQRWLIGALLLWLALVAQAQHLPGAPLLWLGCLTLPWL